MFISLKIIPNFDETKMAIRNNMNLEVRNIVLDLKRLGKTYGQISKILGEVYGYSVTRFGIYKFLQRTKNGNERKPRAGKFTEGHKMVLNLWMSQNSDWTARDIQKMFQKELDVSVSLATIKLTQISAFCAHRTSPRVKVKQNLIFGFDFNSSGSHVALCYVLLYSESSAYLFGAPSNEVILLADIIMSLLKHVNRNAGEFYMC